MGILKKIKKNKEMRKKESDRLEELERIQPFQYFTRWEKLDSVGDIGLMIRGLNMLTPMFLILPLLSNNEGLGSDFSLFFNVAFFSIGLFLTFFVFMIYSLKSLKSEIKLNKNELLKRIVDFQLAKKMNKKDLEMHVKIKAERKYLVEKGEYRFCRFVFLLFLFLNILLLSILFFKESAIIVFFQAIMLQNVISFSEKILFRRCRYLFAKKEFEIVSNVDYGLIINDCKKEEKILETQ